MQHPDQLVVAYRGTRLDGTPYAGGSAVYLPGFVAAVGLNLAELEAAFARPAMYLDRRDRSTLYRGKPLPRSKCYVSATSSRDVLALYKFPGFQYASMLKYVHAGDAAAAPFRPLFDVLASDVTFDGVAQPFTQAIATRYFEGTDCISWHSDKMVSIADKSAIFDISLGGPRTFLLKDKTTGIVESVVMESGSAIAMTTAGNQSHQHAVLPEAGASARTSIVFRHIQLFMSRSDVEKRELKKQQKAARGRGQGAAPPGRGEGDAVAV